MSYIIPDEAALKARSQRFVWRIFMMRQLGTSLCFVAIASVMWDMHYHLFYFLHSFSLLERVKSNKKMK